MSDTLVHQAIMRNIDSFSPTPPPRTPASARARAWAKDRPARSLVRTARSPFTEHVRATRRGFNSPAGRMRPTRTQHPPAPHTTPNDAKQLRPAPLPSCSNSTQTRPSRQAFTTEFRKLVRLTSSARTSESESESYEAARYARGGEAVVAAAGAAWGRECVGGWGEKGEREVCSSRGIGRHELMFE